MSSQNTPRGSTHGFECPKGSTRYSDSIAEILFVSPVYITPSTTSWRVDPLVLGAQDTNPFELQLAYILPVDLGQQAAVRLA